MNLFIGGISYILIMMVGVIFISYVAFYRNSFDFKNKIDAFVTYFFQNFSFVRIYGAFHFDV